MLFRLHYICRKRRFFFASDRFMPEKSSLNPMDFWYQWWRLALWGQSDQIESVCCFYSIEWGQRWSKVRKGKSFINNYVTRNFPSHWFFFSFRWYKKCSREKKCERRVQLEKIMFSGLFMTILIISQLKSWKCYSF